MIQDRIGVIENPIDGEEKVPEGGPEEVLLKQIQAVLYSTEDGFEVPEGQEVRQLR
jgi:RP/EB family microtubule-associated protein